MTSPNADREIVITRVFDAPRELVWQSMTDYPNHSVFQEVVYPERIVYAHGGGRVGAPEVGFVATWTFETTDDGKTRLTMRAVFPTSAERDMTVREYGAIEGGKQTLERLSEHLPTMGVTAGHVVIERLVDAPAELVFRCWTDPRHLQRWWGPRGFTNPVCELDVRIGGTWRIVMRAPDGTAHACQGVHREIVPGERLVFTTLVTDAAGNRLIDGLTEVTFTEEDGKTRMTVSTSAIALVADALRHLAGMEAGWLESLERLDTELGLGTEFGKPASG